MDILHSVNLPDELRTVCPSLFSELENAKQGLGKIVDDEIEDRATTFERGVDRFRNASDHMSQIVKRARQAARDISAEQDQSSRSKKRKLIKALNKTDGTLLEVRTFLTRPVRELDDMRAAREPDSLMLSSVIHEWLTGNRLKWPRGTALSQEDYNEMWRGRSRDSRQQSDFRDLLIARYCPETKPAEEDCEMLWDPVLAEYVPSTSMIAAHLAPCSLGVNNYAWLLGIDFTDEDAIWEQMFSARNGLMLHRDIEKALDNASIVIVPDSKEDDRGTEEYKLVVLSPDKLRGVVWKYDFEGEIVNRDCTLQYWKDLDGRRLKWQTDARPDKTNLYMRYLLSRVARSTTLAKGYEQDIEKVPPAKAWAGSRPLKYSMLKNFMAEIGDHVDEIASRSSSGDSTRSVLAEVDVPAIDESAEDLAMGQRYAIRMAAALDVSACTWKSSV